MDFLVPILKIVWWVIASFIWTLNTNITLNINVKYIYITSVLVIVGMILLYVLRYLETITNKKRFVYRLFIAIVVSILFVGMIWKLVKSTVVSKIYIKPIEWFIYDERLTWKELLKKLAFYWINADETDVGYISFYDKKADENKFLHYTLYKLDTSIKLWKKTEYKFLCFNTKYDKLVKEKWKLYIEQDETSNNKLVISFLSKEKWEENTNLAETKKEIITWKRLFFGIYEVRWETILEKILSKKECDKEPYIVQVGNNIFISPLLIYKIAIDKKALNKVREYWFSIPYIQFLLDDKMKKYFIYHWLWYHTFTFNDKSLLLYFLNNVDWKDDLEKMFWSINEEKKEKMISYMSNNKWWIWILILSFVFSIFVFFLSILSYVFYIFVPVYIIYIIRTIVSIESL